MKKVLYAHVAALVTMAFNEKPGTVLCAVLNGILIGRFMRLLEKFLFLKTDLILKKF